MVFWRPSRPLTMHGACTAGHELVTAPAKTSFDGQRNSFVPFGGRANREQWSFGMKHIRRAALAGTAVLALALAATAMSPTFAEAIKMVGGAPMYPSKNIVQNAVHSKDHTTLVAAVKAAGLVDTLEGAGPFTVFAPTNEAFAKLPPGTVATLLKPENKEKLTQILTYHVVSGRLTTGDLREKVKAGGGTGELTTVEGQRLAVKEMGGALYIIDAKGDAARITIGNVLQSNGVIQVVNTVMLPG
jgi:uncharacterized surface protein with fasciclin (FAS1) repeats